jgi:cation diffusion facilitator family transporter
MNKTNLSEWIHDHIFDDASEAAEKSTRLVMWITASMMMIEITAGWWFNSMALLADGWHMSSHAVAIGLSAFAYAAARKFASDKRFAFGTWKIEVLAGFTSAIFLLGVAVMMVVGSIERLLSPENIHYQEAIIVGVLGLIVNVVCAWLLGHAHHDHGPSHGDHQHVHDHDHHRDHQHDLNLKSAYTHVIADAATSVLAIVALVGGWIYGWSWLDPVMGIVGAVLVAIWAKGLVKETAKVLLDREMDHPVVEEIREVLSSENDTNNTRVTDLHVWRVGKNAYACSVSLVTKDQTLTPAAIKQQLSVHDEIVHTTIEIHRL